MTGENNFKEYLDLFEKNVVIGGFKKNLFTKKRMISLKECKLARTSFGEFIGTELDYSVPIAIDYYGLVKKSVGVQDIVEKNKMFKIRSVSIPVVHFSSIKFEDIDKLAPELNMNFAKFKNFLVRLRGFK